MTPCLLPHARSHKGFTLIEIIVTLLLVGITAAIMFPVLGTNLIKSPEPITRVDNQYRLVKEMDTLTAIYRDAIAKGTLNINSFKASHVDTNPLRDAAGTQFLEDTDQDGTYTSSAGTTPILMVSLRLGDQTLYAIFSE
jgi:prepilin-type N-terminal cleavage/methylation domain-containing protein